MRFHQSDHSEHQLRRKTPNGTIDAGYDGTPAQLASGPPPLKHMILPVSNNGPPTPGASLQNDYLGLNHSIHPSSDGWTYHRTSSFGHQDRNAQFGVDANLLPPGAGWQSALDGGSRPAIALDCAPNPQPVAYFPYNNGARIPTALQPIYHQSPGPALFNSGGLLPVPAWPEMNLPNYQSLAHPGVQAYHGFNGQPMLRAHPTDPLSPSGIPLGDSRLDPGAGHFQAASRRLETLNLESSNGYGTPGTPLQDNDSPARFRVKALANAHRAYLELLAYLQQSKKSHSGRSSASKTSSKMARGHPSMTPLTGAKAALEMLTHMCEQSGWRWVDGMLLGGCLHYGLERYEQAHDWFSRIVSLDADHVEAISNVAATLYCLNQHDEAETHWRRAVQKKPTYLEAVEHLVALLCSRHRSKEAVEIIDFVQRSIRLGESRVVATRDATAADHVNGTSTHSVESGTRLPKAAIDADDLVESSRQPGFGSSGYCVPGSENGRVIALIHAKGNMLYALKDIDRASKAFEEAVLISAGGGLNGIQTLIRRIQSVLAPTVVQGGLGRDSLQYHPSGPLLLPPERARHTAQLVFAAHGELPGLRLVPDGAPKKSAVSTTSNSLLSLAKIFQDAMSNGGTFPSLLRHPSGIGDILALYYLSLSLSESPSTANNVGILLASVQQSGSTPQAKVLETSSAPPIPGIVPGSGLHLALMYYNYGLQLDSKHVHLHTNLGSLLKDIGQLDLAIQMYERAVECDGAFDIALTNLANAVKDRGRVSDAIMYYKRAVESNPHFAEAVCGLSTALNSVCDWRGRGGVLLHDGKYDRYHVNEQGLPEDVRDSREGSGLTKKVVDIVSRQLVDASRWGTGILQDDFLETLSQQLRVLVVDDTDKALDLGKELRKWTGRPWEGSRVLRLIERAMKAGVRRWYQDKYIRGQESRSGYPRPALPTSLAVPSAPTVLPFHTFTCPLTAKDIRMISQRNAARISCSTLRSPWLPSSIYPPPPPPNPELNIGYVSSDFNNHPLAHLMQSVFGFHNPLRAKAFCYATTASDRSVHRQQIEREAPVFRDVSSWPPERLVQQIVEDKIHILVNLNGYTRGARNEIFAARPAPIQMSFMGFAGTLGAEWCDYILADKTAIPPPTLRPMRSNLGLEDVFRDEELNEAEGWMYSENIIFCRDSFFCCDHAQSCEPGERTVTWHEEQRRRWKMRKEIFPNLSDDAIILGNFNQLYKIDPTTFRTWLRILANVPKAILWLLKFPELGENNLKRTARDWAGDEVASRIWFTDVAPKQQHISRARVCDLFLDTPECNAHTTAADVLWSSTPLLTLPRYPYKMCSRMAASILKGALPGTAEGHQAAKDLIADDDAHYEDMATRLAGSLTYRRSKAGDYCEGRGRLAEIRKILFDAKWTCGLFNTRRWVSDLESAYEEAWRRWLAGEAGDIYL
ncbi:hypothetical protein DL764_004463 [Monosporascus ibericus]|uniref:protein O-GlcNAc transferase n=1 Tax=Monosporascus ibericus TaxID=155417 RepID=A0A4Q4TEI9_9PEZI|nr:hypothetical protein DL764_004463 [Monosporascus ibericus]